MIKIENTALPSPTKLSVTVKPIAGASARNTLGQLVRDTLAFKRAVTLVWRRMDQATLTALLALIEGKDAFLLTYHDPAQGATSITCACSSRTMDMERYQGGAPIWSDVTLTLEER